MELCTQTVPADHEVEITRRVGSHHPTVWGDHFLAYANLPGASEEEEKQHEDLKEEVRKMLVMTPSNALEKLELINTIQCLGVAYHFEHEIEEALSYMCTHYEEYWIGDLHAIALCFRLLRQQGYRVSCDAYKKFTDDQGNFKIELINDVHGMLSLYEAAQFRDRLAEVYFWSLGVYFEPQYSTARKILTKNISMISLIDDTYDIYGTLDELTLFTEAIERWNIDASEQLQLPSYMKIIYCGLLDVYDEIKKDLANENKSFLINYSIIEMKKMVMAYFQEAKWYYGKTIPKMEEYMKNGISTSAYVQIATTSWLGMGNVATKDSFDWIVNEPPILVASSIIARLLNDLLSHEEEQKRGDAPSGVECYMKEYGVTKEEAHIKIRNIIENSWKDLYEEYFKVNGTIIPRVLFMCIINLARVVEFLYKDEDAYTFSKNNLKDVIYRILIDPII